jgi:hypothetical protein
VHIHREVPPPPGGPYWILAPVDPHAQEQAAAQEREKIARTRPWTLGVKVSLRFLLTTLSSFLIFYQAGHLILSGSGATVFILVYGIFICPALALVLGGVASEVIASLVTFLLVTPDYSLAHSARYAHSEKAGHNRVAAAYAWGLLLGVIVAIVTLLE